MGDDIESYTTSLKSSVLQYRYENGRRYHAFVDDDGKYMFPNDEEENDRLDLWHHIQTLSLSGKHHLAPIGDQPQRILDIGTGTGIWACDMGRCSKECQYPSADILGNDISPIQPTVVPVNVRFEVDDVEKNWVYSQKFDYIHSRYMTCSIRDWPKLMKQSYQFTKPGGWVEFQDYDLHWYTTNKDYNVTDNPFFRWSQLMAESVRKYGIEPDPGPKLKQWVEDAGFVNVSAHVFPIPMGTWPKDKRLKEIGAFNILSMLDNLEGITMRALKTGMRWSADEVKVFCAQIRNALRDKSARFQSNFYVVYGQKPQDAVS
ncbi:S-adenosyl-L-methionine-dependent methyltransferase [Sporormia fimetaria CBS 119925]|uniref:S-adenosyl-L-methionine-dependent methyltransferase n=1 Tax=Sporormia fimetaria CBS 119925 TaxID=1340428 RepID=A0A6A6UXW6_9PLEO|nr:S-adenosyl-L-methionine-dependent methyltransferase [Sporormia fimetaria CBS 119925]